MTSEKVITPFGQKVLDAMATTNSNFGELAEIIGIRVEGEPISPARLEEILTQETQEEQELRSLIFGRMKSFFRARNYDLETDAMGDMSPSELTDKIYEDFCEAAGDLVQHLRYAPKKELERFIHRDGQSFENILKIGLYEHKQLKEKFHK